MEDEHKSSKTMVEEFKETVSENENQEEVVPLEIDSEDENECNETEIRALPNNFINSTPVRETLGSLLKSRNFLGIIQDDPGRARFRGVHI